MDQRVWLAAMFNVVPGIQPKNNQHEAVRGEAKSNVVRAVTQGKEGTRQHNEKK
jgi:hypothetical protein